MQVIDVENHLERVMESIESSVDKTVTKLQDVLALWGAKLTELAAKVDAARQEGKGEARKQLDQARDKLELARSKLDEAKETGEDRWDKFKAAVESSWKELEGAFLELVRSPRA